MYDNEIEQPRRQDTRTPVLVSENGKTTPGMDFSMALEHLKKGSMVTREGWNGKSMFIFMVPGSTFKVNCKPLSGIFPEGTEIKYHAHLDLRAADGQIVVWNPSQADLFAEDWVLVGDVG